MTETDQGLLEMAAKATGRKTTLLPPSPTPIRDWVHGDDDWDPLTNDGDALRLASHFCMLVNTGPCEASASTIDGVLRGFVAREETIVQGQDEAVRRAIVRAAAEIGRAIP
ncbi:hypothetical protein P353_25070 [Comamonas testosteroni]|uniref:Uncharacterized protein n=2 Tax=Comamonas testosteroni TaxID=285 RepID=A0A096F6T2_COMTE|nr:hypothetical protein P353_25070 [Comamonas testosteroni]